MAEVTGSHSSPNHTPNHTIDHIVRCYGDLLFDLCESILWSPSNAQVAFRAILKQIKRGLSTHAFTDHQRAWVLRVACDQLRAFSQQHGRRLTSSEQINLDSTQHISNRLKQFDSYF